MFTGYGPRSAAKHAAVNVVNYVNGVSGGLPPGVPAQHTTSLQQHLGQWVYHQQQAAAAVNAGNLSSVGMSMNSVPSGFSSMSQGLHSGSGFISPGMPSSHRSSGSGVKDASPRGPVYSRQIAQQMQSSQGLSMSGCNPSSANTATAAAVAAAAAQASRQPHHMVHGGGWGQQTIPPASAMMDSSFSGNGSALQGVSADQHAYILQAMANMQIAMSQGIGVGGLTSGPVDDVTQSSINSGELGARSGSTGALINRPSATGSGNSASGHFDTPGPAGCQSEHTSGWQ
jgi:hypothetical protein